MSARWKRNAVVAVMAVLVCSAVALNWMYTGQEVEDASGKLLGEATLVSKQEDGKQESQSDPAKNPEDSPAESTGAPADEDAVYTGSDYFASARLTRQQARDNALSLLQEAAEQENADQTVANEASQGIQVLASYTLKEAQIENLVTAKGYSDGGAFIGEKIFSVGVAAAEEGLTDVDVARITEIVTDETGFTGGQIKIIPAQP